MREAIAGRLVGTRVRRVEDPRLLTGTGRYVDDVTVPGMLHATFVRSPTAHALIRIPANAAYLSLNLAMAVQLVAYELFRACHGDAGAHAPAGPPLASEQEMARLYAHFAQVLEEIEFRDRTQSGTHLMGRIRRFLQRAELDENEVNILRGILTAVQSGRRHAGAER